MAVKSLESDEFWNGVKRDQRNLKRTLKSLRAELSRLGKLYENCRSLWVKGDFKSLSEILEREGIRSFHEMPNMISELDEKIEGVLRDLKMIDEDLKKGVACPECGGLGSMMERQYVRSEGNIIPIVKTKECPFCKGSGRLLPYNAH